MNNSRIAKNTLSLYIRMFLTMGVSLFTARIVLEALGTVDYGIYEVVAGFVSLLIFMKGTLASAASRFFAFEIGKDKDNNLEKVFRSALSTHIIFGLIVVIFLETVGIWFLNNKLVIPPERFNAAVWIFHFSVIGAFFSVIQTPLSALIIASEKMAVFAWLGIFDAIIKLIVTLSLLYTKSDKLIVYGFLLKLSQILLFLIHHFYCKKNFSIYKLKPLFEKSIQKTMLSYTGWSILGSCSSILKSQGINIILNVFFGPTVNAARGIAFRISSIVNRFTQNFTMAMNPQIIKRYASGNIMSMTNLVGSGAKFSFFLLFVLGLPVLFQAEFLLNIWLVEVPEYAVVFTKLLIINSLIDSFSYAMGASIQATGDIKKYQLLIGGVQLLNVPIAFLLLKAGCAPPTVFYIPIIFAIISIFLRITILKSKIPEFTIKLFMSVLYYSLAVVVTSIIPLLFIKNMISNVWLNFIFVTCMCFVSTTTCIWFVGLNKLEKNWLFSVIKTYLNKSRNVEYM
ncbi:MAG TPA: lipopolysaccharide biosynthesis protein [Mariniphaga sp.]|nr:lipopolysaccharide biosynthesis protein [Mariniphaga sp.]